MSIEEVVEWYEKNVNYKLTKAFLNFLVKIGIVEMDVDLELLNLFLLTKYDDVYIKKNDKYIIKKNRIKIIDSYKDVREDVQENKKIVKKNIVTIERANKSNKKFKIETLGGKRMKLVKL